jgi:manganese transport protein
MFGATASNARLFADALAVFGLRRYESPEARADVVRAASVLLPVLFTSVFLVVGNPVSLVFVGAMAQGLMLPFLAFAALHFNWFQTDPALRPHPVFTFGLVLSALAMSGAGLYQVVQQVRLLAR